jgi:hypothetical protein
MHRVSTAVTVVTALVTTVTAMTTGQRGIVRAVCGNPANRRHRYAHCLHPDNHLIF